MKAEELLFTIVEEYTDVCYIHPVFHWYGYGIVCPTLCTTNGYYKEILKCKRPNWSFLPAQLQVNNVQELDSKLENYCINYKSAKNARV